MAKRRMSTSVADILAYNEYNYAYIREAIKKWLELNKENNLCVLRQKVYGKRIYSEEGRIENDKYKRVCNFVNDKGVMLFAKEILALCDIQELNINLEKALGMKDERYDDLYINFKKYYKVADECKEEKSLDIKYLENKWDKWKEIYGNPLEIKQQITHIVEKGADKHIEDRAIWCCKKMNAYIIEHGGDSKMKISYRILLCRFNDSRFENLYRAVRENADF